MVNRFGLHPNAAGSIPASPTICQHERVERCLYMENRWWWLCLSCSTIGPAVLSTTRSAGHEFVWWDGHNWDGFNRIADTPVALSSNDRIPGYEPGDGKG